MSTSEPGRGKPSRIPGRLRRSNRRALLRTLCCAIDADSENSRVPAHLGELGPQHITPVWRRAIGEELGRASLDEAYRRLVAAGGAPSQDLSTIYGDVPDQDEGDHDGEY